MQLSRWVSALSLVLVHWPPYCFSPDVRSDTLSSTEHPPLSGGSFSEAANDFCDGSYALYALYNERSSEHDRELVNTWSEHVRDLMVLVRYTSLRFSHLKAHCLLDIKRVVYSRRLLQHSLHSLI
jgi:hypothetical protein